MFERFTNSARRTIVEANFQARSLGHDWIGTEHVLLGLLAVDDGLAAQALLGSDIDLAIARAAVVLGIPPKTGEFPEHIPFTPRSKKVLDLALRGAHLAGDRFIATDHVLVALVSEGDGIAAQILATHGVELDSLVERLAEMRRAGPRPSEDDEEP